MSPLELMRIWLTVIVAYKSLDSNRIRSLLTTLGIIIGVAAVIILIDVTRSAEKMIKEQLSSLGGKSFIVKYGKRGVRTSSKVQLTAEDADAIRELDLIKYASPLLDSSEQVVWRRNSWFTVILGTSPDFVHINDWFPSEGNFFSYRDTEESAKVCVLGSTVSKKLFVDHDPVNETIKINGYFFKVIGVMEPLGQTTGGTDQDDIILIPYTTFNKTIRPDDAVESISVYVKNAEELEAAKLETVELLRKRHDVSQNDELGFYFRSQEGIIERIFTISKIMRILLSSIASISLIVGGIGIMNIMLVSIRERTREIGVRLSVGAKESDILTQFLIESVVLSITGGGFGILMGIVISVMVSFFTKWPLIISIDGILLAFMFSFVIGVFFGIYPAYKASKMNPIDALRYE
jgi:putative ABC transport system permease protein